MNDAVNAPTTQSVTLAGGDVVELSWFGATDTGRRRETNQDAFLTVYPLFVVADGMGGHVGGEIASASTVERLGAMVGKGEVSPKTIEKALTKAVADIVSHPEATDEGTGTTLTGVYLDTDEATESWVTLNIGDSRVYLLRDGGLTQLTTDHSVVQELMAAGRLSAEEAENHPYGNVITRAVGPSEGVAPDYVRVEIVDGDAFVICSDGLTKELTDYGIGHFLVENEEPKAAVEAMMNAALENGGRDNVTIIVLKVARTGAGVEEDTDNASDAVTATDSAAEVDSE